MSKSKRASDFTKISSSTSVHWLYFADGLIRNETSIIWSSFYHSCNCGNSIWVSRIMISRSFEFTLSFMLPSELWVYSFAVNIERCSLSLFVYVLFENATGRAQLVFWTLKVDIQGNCWVLFICLLIGVYCKCTLFSLPIYRASVDYGSISWHVLIRVTDVWPIAWKETSKYAMIV